MHIVNMWWSVVVRGGPSGGPILYGKNTINFLVVRFFDHFLVVRQKFRLKFLILIIYTAFAILSFLSLMAAHI